MMNFWRSDKTIITRLRVHGAGADPLSAQLRLANLLNAADWHPGGLSSTTILCIRRLRDPLPGKLPMQANGVRPPRAWEQAVRSSLEAIAQRAARPALGIVPANAEAVLFADRAELLACLASDYCSGMAITRWWWQSLFRGVDISRAVLSAWHEAPEYAPAALQHLAENKSAVPFVRAFNDDSARVLAQSLTQRFALLGLQSALKAVSDDAGAAQKSESDAPRLPKATAGAADAVREEVGTPPHAAPHHEAAISTREASPVAPWERWAPEVRISALSVEQQCLLGLGLMLHRAPAVVRAPSFAQQVREWRRTRVEKSATFAATTTAPPPEDRQASIAAPPEPLAFHHLRFTPPELKRETENVNVESVASHDLRFTPPDVKRETENANVESVTSHDLRFTSPDIKSETKNVNDAPVTLHALRFTPIETAYGGVFYLINLGLFLNLYGDFTTPLQPGIALSIWDFLALLGEQFLGEKIKSDPVWPLLAQLAGRSENEAPGKDFEPPDQWRLPPEWLATFPEAGVWEWTAEGERLRVKHPEQFLIIDLPLAHGDPEQQLQQEMQAYAGIVAFELQPANSLKRSADFKKIASLKSAAKKRPVKFLILLLRFFGRFYQKKPPIWWFSTRNDSFLEFAPAVRWLNWLMPYVRARLLRALGLSRADELPKILCEHHAYVFATATHLDIQLSLAELPIAIRLAGLDRDPGWVPAAGRFIDFRFTIAD